MTFQLTYATPERTTVLEFPDANFERVVEHVQRRMFPEADCTQSNLRYMAVMQQRAKRAD